MFKETRAPLFPPVPQVAAARDISIAGSHGAIPARCYRPLGSSATTALPAVVFFHGGGWVVGDLDTHDILCRELANQSSSALIAVDYRLAPEHAFPAAFDDALAATRWVAANAASLAIDAARLAVAGDSAGGNLAAAVALACRGAGPALRMQLLIYPVTDFSIDTASYRNLGQDYLLTRELMRYFIDCYVPDRSLREDWRAAPLRAKDLAKLPEAFIAAAEYDPLLDEGKAYAERLAAAGVPVTYRLYPGMLHGFYLCGGVIDMTQVAIAEAGAALRRAFA